MNLYRVLFFIIFIFVSKEVLIFNEEFLILCAFICFNLLFLNYGRFFIYSELKQRKLKLVEEFCIQYDLEKKVLISLIDFNKKKSRIMGELEDISITIFSEIIKLEIAYVLLIYSEIYSHIDYKLRKLSNTNPKLVLYLLISRKFSLIIRKYYSFNHFQKQGPQKKCLFFRSLFFSKSSFLSRKRQNKKS